MDRRSFNKTLSLGVEGLSIGIGKAFNISGTEISASGASNSTAPVSKCPYAYRRLLVDTHVPTGIPCFFQSLMPRNM